MPKRPLPRAKCDVDGPPVGQDPGHAGLWYEKLGGTWQVGWSLQASSGGSSPKLDWMKPLLDRDLGSPQLLKEHAGRQRQLARRLGGRAVDLENRSPFVTGLGQAHPVENGFLWHPSLGVPYLPGSGVKGVIRSWLKMEGPLWAAALSDEPVPEDEAAVDPDQVARLLGGRKSVGAVDLLALLPTRPLRLRADLVNPHYGPYQRGQAPPADWHDPVPSFFLTVAPRALWQLAVVPGPHAEKGDVDQVTTWLIQAADGIGFGAKTAVGYGRFREV